MELPDQPLNPIAANLLTSENVSFTLEHGNPSVLTTMPPHNISTIAPLVLEDPIVEEAAPRANEVKPETVEEPKTVEEEKPTVSISKHKKNIELLADYNFQNNIWDEALDTYRLPSAHEDDLSISLQAAPNISIGDNPESRNWAKTIQDAASNVAFNGALVDALERENSDYKQVIQHDGKNLVPATPRFKSLENESLKGDNAVIRMATHLGLGSLFQVPLWHSGFWITFKPPSEAALVELQRLIMSDKIQYGRYSYGRLYTGLTAYTVDRLVNFALEHIYDCTIKTSEIAFSQLKEYIALEDIFPLLWGFMATVYPKGFQYERACTSNPEKCHHVSREKLNLARLLWVDNSSLTDWQKAHMTARSSQTKDKASVLKYRQDLLRVNDRRYKLVDTEQSQVYVTFQIGFVKDYIEASYKWIQDITAMVENVVSKDISDKEKEDLIETHGKASTLRQSTHQVKSLEFDSNIIEDQETIEKTLDLLSSGNTIIQTFFDLLNQFNNDATLAVVGIPTFNCPNCHEEQKTEIDSGKFVNIIPLDVIQLFFDLISQRLLKITVR